jgi:hypothetical protein
MPSMTKAAKHGGANLALAKAMVGKRSSGAAGPHADKRNRRARTRSAQRARVLKEW